MALEARADGDGFLDLEAVIGFAGGVREGLILHPDDVRIIYPLGSTIVVRSLADNTQKFLQKDGHDRSISSLALSPSGKYLASGQITHIGFAAVVVVWDLDTFGVVHKLKLHKGRVQHIAWSKNEKYLATLGGQDDNKLVIWDMKTGDAVCGAPAANDVINAVKFFNGRDDMLVTGGSYNLKVWEFDLANRKIRPHECNLGQLKRVITCIAVDENDEYMYCGTQTGDLLQVSLGPKLFKDSGPAKKPFSLGIQVVTRTNKGNLIVGTGEGTIALLQKDTFKIIKQLSVLGSVTSLALNAKGDHFFVGTDQSNVYLVELATFEFELRNTCHFGPINDVCFPNDYSELFATCSVNDIRVWHARTRNELLRIQVPNLQCLCVSFQKDGKSIISGWNDGKIRAFKPQSGTLLYTINDAHTGGVSAISSTNDCTRVISGGVDGRIRVWLINKSTQTMVSSLKEHKGAITLINVKHDDTECVSSSTDGSCISWDLARFVRNAALFASTQFNAILYHPDESQLLTTGTDRKITYWDSVDGNRIRVIDGSPTSELNSLAISSDGSRFVSGGSDKMVKVWDYDEGHAYYYGIGHSGSIKKVVISPDQKTVVSVGDEGSVFIWTLPPKEQHDAAVKAGGVKAAVKPPSKAEVAAAAIASGNYDDEKDADGTDDNIDQGDEAAPAAAAVAVKAKGSPAPAKPAAAGAAPAKKSGSAGKVGNGASKTVPPAATKRPTAAVRK